MSLWYPGPGIRLIRQEDVPVPKLDQNMPSGAAMNSTLEVAANDARFLIDAMPELETELSGLTGESVGES